MSSYMTSAEFEKLCNLPKGAAAQMRYRGQGPSYAKFVGRVRYSREAIDEWIKANTHTSTAAA